MRNKVTVIFLCAALIFAVLSTSVFARDDYKERTYFKLDRAPKYLIPFERNTFGAKPDVKSDASMALIGNISTNSPGQLAGLTTYDYQHNGSSGRQIAFYPGTDLVHFVWMAQDNYLIPGNRGIKYQCYDAGLDDYLMVAGGKFGSQEYCGYTSVVARPGGKATFAAHVNPGTDVYNCWSYTDYAAGGGIFSDIEIASPDPLAPWYFATMETIWPIIDQHVAGGDVTENVIYMLTHVFEGGEDMILYRKVGTGPWDGGQLIETVTDLAYMVVADPYSNKVACVYTDDRTGMTSGQGSQTNLDLWYKESTDQGVTWGNAINVTNYNGDSLWRAYSDLSALYLADGHLHILWPARELRDSNTYENAKARLLHWSSGYPHARIVAEARYTMTALCDPGSWNLYIAKPSISECEGRLYALWTQFGHARAQYGLIDCSQGGYANGEIFLGVSNDDGFTWDLPTNLTNTRTPNCDSAECDSDHWSSMVRQGMAYGDGTVRDTLDLQYINDKDAGGIPSGEGTWCVNNVMHLRIPCRDIVPSPQVSLNPTSYLDPTQTLPGVELDTILTVINIGNATLTGTFSVAYENGDAWITINNAPTAAVSVPAGSDNQRQFTVRLNAGGLITDAPTGWDAQIILTSNAAATSPDIIPVHLTVGTLIPVEFAVLNTTCKTLKVYNSGRVGDHDGNHSMIIPGDCDTTTTYPDQRYLYDGSPMLSWMNGSTKTGYTTVFDQLFTEQQTWRPQTNLVVTTETGYDKAAYTIASADSLFGVDVEIYAPTDGDNCFFIKKMSYYLWGSTPDKNDVYVGYFIDWDTPSDSNVDNGSGYSETPYYNIYQRGAEWQSDNLPCAIDESNRRGGMAVLQGPVLGAWTELNTDGQQGTGFKPGFLYDKMIVSGTRLYTPTGTESTYDDLHTGLTFEKVNLTAGAKFSYIIALITTNLGAADYDAQVQAAADFADAIGLLGCCDTPGDANNDVTVNVGDAVFIINYVFKGGDLPACMQEADANADATINVGDAVFIINYVFKGGDAPVCGP